MIRATAAASKSHQSANSQSLIAFTTRVGHGNVRPASSIDRSRFGTTTVISSTLTPIAIVKTIAG